ncbi:MAG: LPS export ABC transporter permease LptF [Gammaproteobacteria bacterium]|nr:LPS export ABC transporter permease LptF [Gammaproteobacteria bacterium]MBV9619827.1 LPS export ABC transporter permease LptF [Gammaproteobacteria bacterium]
MASILGRYILREVVAAWLLVTGVLLVILLVNEVVGVLERAATNQFPQGVVLELIWLGALQNLSILLPVGLLLGVVLAFGRLYADSEMAAALACGAAPRAFYLPVAGLAVLVSAGLAWLTLELAPNATVEALTLRQAAMRAGQFAPIAPGKFRTFGGGSAVVYAQDVNPDGTLHNVFVERSRGPFVLVALAERAQHAVTPDGQTHILTLYSGSRFEGVPGTAEFRIVHFAEHVVPVQVPALRDLVRDLEARPSGELLASADPKARAELHWRVAMPLMCLVLALLAVPLARLRPRQGRYARIWLAVLIFLLYSQLISVGKVWIARGNVPAALGLWWTHAVVVLLALLVILGPGFRQRLRYRRSAA